MVLKFTNLKEKILKLQQAHYVQEIFQKIGQHNNMKRTGFTGYVYGFSVDYNAIEVDDIKNIRKYLMVKNNIV